MKLTEKHLVLLSQCAISAAYQAGHLISNFVASKIEVKNKAEGLSAEELKTKVGGSLASQVVTEVDVMSQEIIIEALTPTLELFDIGLLTEESVDDATRFQKDYFWCIDPIDGTLPFIEQTPGFSVSIALVAKDGTPHIGVVYDPVKKNLYSAVKNLGLKRNGSLWKPFENRDFSDQPLRLITDRSFFNYKYASQVVAGLTEAAHQLGYSGFTVQALGGAVMNACWGLEKAPACYFKFPKANAGGGSLWDYAATAVLYSEADAWVSDMKGEALDLNREDSTFLNHRGALYASNSRLAKYIISHYKEWIK